MNLTDFGFIMRNRIAYGINAVSQRLIEKLQNEKLDKIIVEATTSVTDYLVSPYTMLSALPFGDSSLRLGDGSIFVHKDEMIESTMIVVFNNGIRTYGLAVDSQTAEVTALVDQGSWTLNQVGLSVNDIYNPSYWVDTNPSLKSTLASKKSNFAHSTGWKATGDTWTNGKAMYRKVFTFNKVVTAAGSFNLGSVDSGYAVVRMNGYFVYSGTTRFLPVANGNKTTEVYLGSSREIMLRVANDTWSADTMQIVLIMDAYKA